MDDQTTPSSSVVLGVDLGTTFTTAALQRPGRDPEMLSLGASGYGVPSVLVLRDDGTFLAGEDAALRAASDPTRVARFFKRQLGDGSTRIVGGTPFTPQTLTSHLLRWVLGVASGRLGAPPDRVVLTHPANWGPYRREIFEQAAAMAGVDDLVLCTEPEAAAINYAASAHGRGRGGIDAEQVDDGELIGVYDLGGGTFDAVVLRRTGDRFEIVGQPRGVERLGGIDFDDAILGFVAEACGIDLARFGAGDEATVAAGHRLRDDCIAAKRLLSADTFADLRVTLPGVERTVRLTRQEFEQRVRPRLVESLTAFEAALHSGGVAPDDLSRILLVGGSSRIPLVAQLVTEAFGRPIAVDSDPKNAVALGAARFGASRDAEPTDTSAGSPAGDVLDIRSLPDLAPGPPPPKLTTVDLRSFPPPPAPAPPPGTPAAPVSPPTEPVAAPAPTLPDTTTTTVAGAGAAAASEPTPIVVAPPSDLAGVASESRHRIVFPAAVTPEPAAPVATATTARPDQASRALPVLLAVGALVVLIVIGLVLGGVV